MRQGRYRKNFLRKDQCAEFALKFAPAVASMRSLHSEGALTSVELTASYVAKGLQILRPTGWKGSRFSIPIENCARTSDLNLFSQFGFRGLPMSVNRSLLRWNQNPSILKLFFEIPSTETVLELQSRGIRCVTCLCRKQELENYVLEERDPLSFTIHDLIHADHFFNDPTQKVVQVGFSRWLLEIWQKPDLQLKLASHFQFRQNFEYACADMNSHGAHLLKYLKAIFCQAQVEPLLFSLSEQSSLNSQFTDCLRTLNTPLETPDQLRFLQQALFAHGQPAASERKSAEFCVLG